MLFHLYFSRYNQSFHHCPVFFLCLVKDAEMLLRNQRKPSTPEVFSVAEIVKLQL